MLWLFVLLVVVGCLESSSKVEKAYLLAEKLGLQNFSECMSQSHEDVFSRDRSLAQQYGIKGTPSFVINGQVLVGARPYPTFEQAFQQASSREPHYALQPGDIWWGNPNASIVVVEFSSPKCPFCQRFHKDTYPKIKENFISKGEILWIYKHYVLGKGEEEKELMKIITCGAREGKAEEFLKVVYS